MYHPRRRETWQKQLDASAQVRAQRLYDHFDFLLEQKKQAEQDLLRESKKHRIVGMLETAPGFGPIRAARLVPIVVTPHRFRTKRQFWSYSGFAVVTRSTDDYRIKRGKLEKRTKVSTRGLNRNHNSVMKSVFKSAAKDASRGELEDFYQSRIDAGMRSEMALLTVARKLCAVALAIWKKGEIYDQAKAVKAT